MRHDAQGLGASAANLQRSIANAMRGAQRAAALTQRLLAFSRRQPLNPTVLDLNKYLPGVGEFLNAHSGRRSSSRSPARPALADRGRRSAARASLVNLAVNARDAMPNGGKLTVEASNQTLDRDYRRTNPEVAPGQYVLICVSDTGHGMTRTCSRAPSSHFSPPRRSVKGRVSAEPGLRVRQAVRRTREDLQRSRARNDGEAVLPARPRAHRCGRGRRGDSHGSGDGEIILVVEDDNDLRAYLIEALRDLDYRAIGAPDADAALGSSRAAVDKIDLMLTDVVMPGMNGRELAKRARELRPGLKVLFMSGYSRNAVVHHGRVDLDVQLIQKPVSLKELTTRIRDMWTDRTPIESHARK